MAEQTAVSRVGLRHVGDPSTRLATVRNLLGLTFTYRDAFSEEMAKLIDREMDSVQVLDVMEDIWNVAGATTEKQERNRKATAAAVLDVYQTSTTVAPFYGTAFGAYNAVTEWTDHLAPIGKASDTDEERAIKRAHRVLTSADTDALKVRAFSALAAV
jgi:hypothetical protein